MKTLRDIIDEEIKKFAAEQLPLIRKGTADSMEELLKRVEEFEGGMMDCWNDVIYALIKEGIKSGEKMKLAPLIVEAAVDVQLLDAVDPEDDEIDWGSRKTPFITEDVELLELLATTNFNTMARPVAWTDGRMKYFMTATPTAAAMASGNVRAYEILKDKCPFFGDYSFTDEEDHFFKGHDAYGGIYHISDLRLRSPVEAALLSNNLEMIKEATATVFGGREFVAWAREHKGEMKYYDIYKSQLPTAVYWLDEECSRYLDGYHPGFINMVDIETILETANPVFLEHWLELRDELPQEMVEYMINKLEHLRVPVMTADIVWEQARLKGVHCIPCDQQWLDERIKKCVSIIKNFKMEV